MKPNNAENGNFGKLTYASSLYKEVNTYISTQPLDKRKRGFGTKDASRRDEFTSSIRTEQYRQGIRKEMSILKAPSEPVCIERSNTAPPMLLSESGTLRRETLYDIGRTKVTEFNPRSSRDRFYNSNSSKEKKLGPYRPASFAIGDSAWDQEYKPPTYGATSEVKV